MTAVNEMGARRILIVGGGYVGMYAALRLQGRLRRELRRGQIEVTVVDPRSYMTYQPFLPEAAAGSVEPRHVVVPLRRVLPRVDVVTGRITAIRHGDRTVSIEPRDGRAYELSYDILVVALGSIARTLPVPGLAEVGIGFKRVEEAIQLRNHVLDRLDLADSTDDPDVRERALSFTFVGGGYAGIEALAELEDMARYACRYYDQVAADDMRWVLVEAMGRILPEVGEEMGWYAVEALRERGIEVHLNTKLSSCEEGRIRLDDGTEFNSDTVVWTAGVKANPVLRETDLPVDDKGRVACTAELQVPDVEDVWAAGDNAAVPDLTGPKGATCGPSAQHAVRQAATLADNIVRSLHGRRLEKYRHRNVGSVASLGLYKGVAHVYGVKLTGWTAWFLHRTYHIGKMPTINRRARILLDWTLALFFRREVVSLGNLQRPREEFLRSAVPRQRSTDTELDKRHHDARRT